MINLHTWHRDEKSQKQFTWQATLRGLELDHQKGNISYVIPWGTFNQILNHAMEMASTTNNVITAGTSQDNPTPGSLGEWILTQNFVLSTGNLTPRHLSFIGPILGHMGFITRQINGNSIQWRFNP